MDSLRGFRSTGAAVFFYSGLIVFVCMTLLPLVWVFKMSIITQSELFMSPPTIWPERITLRAYETVFGDLRFRRGVINSAVVAGSTTVISLAVGSCSAYALARIKFRLRSFVGGLVLAVAFFPPVVIIAPLFMQLQGTGIINTYWAMIIPDVLFSCPLTVYLLLAYFRELPFELEEAAKVDGATSWQAFRKITLPLAVPGIVTAGLLTFVFAWNEFLFANTFSFDLGTQPVTVVIPNFATIYTTDFAAQAAAAILVTVPLVILVLLFQRRIVAGLTAGAVH
jgi:multiple sugar transport system permease protein